MRTGYRDYDVWRGTNDRYAHEIVQADSPEDAAERYADYCMHTSNIVTVRERGKDLETQWMVVVKTVKIVEVSSIDE